MIPNGWLLDDCYCQACPSCQTLIQKNGGCNHITCRHCNFEWCWLCACKYQPGHYRNGKCEQFSQDFFDEIALTRDEFEEQFVVENHWWVTGWLEIDLLIWQVSWSRRFCVHFSGSRRLVVSHGLAHPSCPIFSSKFGCRGRRWLRPRGTWSTSLPRPTRLELKDRDTLKVHR